MTIVYIIFILICVLLILAIVFGILLYKQIKERLNYYDDIAEFIEFNDVLLNKSVIECIVKYDKHISITTNSDSNTYIEKFNSEEKCNNRYLDILDCISYYPKLVYPENNDNKQEWSKEDKEMLGKVLECIRFADERYQLEDEKTNGIAVKGWLLNHINLS